MNHRRCRQAAIGPAPTPGSAGGTFACSACGEELGSWIRRDLGTLLEARRDLHAAGDHDGIPAFGLPARTRERGRGPRTPRQAASVRRAVAVEDWPLAGRPPLAVAAEAYAYCPRRGCGAGQHLTPPSG